MSGVIQKIILGNKRGGVLIYSLALSSIILFFAVAIIYGSISSKSKIKLQAITDEAARYGVYQSFKNLCRIKEQNDIQKKLVIAHLAIHGVCLCSSTCNLIPFVGPIVAAVACAACVIADPIITIGSMIFSIIMDIYPAIAGYMAYSDVSNFVSSYPDSSNEGTANLVLSIARWGQRVKIGKPFDGTLVDLNWHSHDGDKDFPIPYPFPSGAIGGDDGVIRNDISHGVSCVGVNPCVQWLSSIGGSEVHRFLKYDVQFYSNQGSAKSTIFVKMKVENSILSNLRNFMSLFADTSRVKPLEIFALSQAMSSPNVNEKIQERAKEVDEFLTALALDEVKGVIDDEDVCSVEIKDIANSAFFVEYGDLPLIPHFYDDRNGEINNILKEINDLILH